ncbi:hypothetical protein ANCDUO_24199, partial [Ancylostoma duodenale]
LKHDRSFSLTARAVAYEVVKRLNELLQPIIEGDEYDLADYGLNTLSRNVSAVKSSIRVYADVVKAIKKERLIGGQVLTMLHRAREGAVVSKDIQDLSEIFEVQEIEKVKSAVVLKQLRTAIPFDSAIRQQLRRLSDAFIKGLAVKFPFVSNFKLSYSTNIVFEELRAFGLIVDAPKEPLPVKEQPIALDLLTLTYTPPAKMGKLIPIYVVSLYVFVFRVCLQLHAAINCLSDALVSF